MTGVIVRSGHGLLTGLAADPFQIHVKADRDEECGIIFSIDDETWIGESNAGETLRADIDVLSDNATVAVWYGSAYTSCPGQSRAEAVIRLE